MLVLSELVSNAIKHAAPLPSGEIRVRWSVRPTSCTSRSPTAVP